MTFEGADFAFSEFLRRVMAGENTWYVQLRIIPVTGRVAGTPPAPNSRQKRGQGLCCAQLKRGFLLQAGRVDGSIENEDRAGLAKWLTIDRKKFQSQKPGTRNRRLS